MGDINSYALGLEFQLKMKPAMEALESMHKGVESLQKALKDATNAFNVTPNEAVGNVDQMIGNHLTSLDKIAADLEAQYAIKAEEISRIGDETHITRLRIEALSKAYHRHMEHIGQLMVQTNMSAEAMKKYRLAVEKVEEKHIKALKTTDKLKSQQKDNTILYRKLTDAVMSYDPELQQMTKTVWESIRSFGVMGVVLGSVAYGIMRIKKYQDEYVHANMRALGTMDDLIRKSGDLGSALGVAQEEQISAFKGLAAAGFTASDNLTDLAKTNAMFNRITRVSNESTAIMQRRILSLGGGMNSVKSIMENHINLVRKYGLTADKSNQMIADMNSTMLEMDFLADNTKDAQDYINKLQEIGALSHKLGLDSKNVQDMFHKMSTDMINNAKAWTLLFGEELDTNLSYSDRLNKLWLGVHKGVNISREQFKDIAKLSASSVEDIFGVSKETLYTLYNLSKEMQKVGGPDNLKNVDKNVDLMAAWNEATSGLAGAFEKLREPLNNIFMKIGAPAVKIITEIVNKMVGWTQALDTFLTKTSGLKSAEILLTGLFVAGTGVAAIMFTKMLFKIGGGLKSLFDITKKAPTAIASTKSGFMSSIAEGIKSFADPKVLRGAINLTLSVAMIGAVMIGFAALIKKFNIGVKDFVTASVGIVLASASFAVSAVILNAVGNTMLAASPKILAFGAAMGVLSLSAIGFSYAFKLISEGFDNLAKSMSELFKVVQPNIGDFVIMVASLGIGLITFSAAMVAIGAMAVPFAVGAAVLSGALYVLGKAAGSAVDSIGVSLPKIVDAIARIPANAGDLLGGLGDGIGRFVGGLFGSSMSGVLGGITSALGLTDNIADRSSQIASAMTTISGPVMLLASALQQIPDIKINSIFEGLADSVPTIVASAMSIDMLAKSLANVNTKVVDVNLNKTQPIRRPLMTDLTARNTAEDKHKMKLLEANKSIKQAVDEVAESLDNNQTLKEISEVIKKTLPDLSKHRSGNGFTSVITQWM